MLKHSVALPDEQRAEQAATVMLEEVVRIGNHGAGRRHRQGANRLADLFGCPAYREQRQPADVTQLPVPVDCFGKMERLRGEKAGNE